MQPKLDDIGGARELAMHRLTVAKDDLAAAEQSFEGKHYRASNNRAYYAIFRAISACLALEFKAFKQHAQVIGNFNKILSIRDFPERNQQENQPGAGNKARQRL